MDRFENVPLLVVADSGGTIYHESIGDIFIDNKLDVRPVFPKRCADR